MGDHTIGTIRAAAVIIRDAGDDGAAGEDDRIRLQKKDARADYDPVRVRAALKELGISDVPQGTRIRSLQGYVETIGKIEKAAPQGGTAERARLAANARAYADAAGIPVDEERLQRLIRGEPGRRRDDETRPLPAVAALQGPKTKL